MEEGELSPQGFEEKRRVAGIIGLLSDLDKKGEEVFDLYKGKEDVELAFDALKNALDADNYLQRIVEPSGREYFAAIPKRAREIAALFPEALPMG